MNQMSELWQQKIKCMPMHRVKGSGKLEGVQAGRAKFAHSKEEPTFLEGRIILSWFTYHTRGRST